MAAVKLEPGTSRFADITSCSRDGKAAEAVAFGGKGKEGSQDKRRRTWIMNFKIES